MHKRLGHPYLQRKKDWINASKGTKKGKGKEKFGRDAK